MNILIQLLVVVIGIFDRSMATVIYWSSQPTCPA